MGLALAGPRPALALVTTPVTVDGPSSAITEFGGVAMASDGTGGLVYVKAVDGVPHVFASRFVGGQWRAPIRVDWGQPFEASEARIAASPNGELLVVWVTQVATVHGKIQHGLFSARLAGGASSFRPALPIDPNVGEGLGVDPSIALASPGKAIVSYRAITFTFGQQGVFTTAVQLRPGDVLAEIRVARLGGDRWSPIGPVNRNPESSVRPPSPTNGPQIGAGLDGSAVVAWQEPDQTGAARIWMRRIFGTTLGPVLQASPSEWEGQAVTADADALSLSVTPYTAAQVAFRIASDPGSALAGRLLVNSLPGAFAPTAGALAGAKLAGGAGAALPGPPAIATAENANRIPSTRVAYALGARLRQQGVQGESGLSEIAMPAGPTIESRSTPVVAVDPAGGGMVAYPAIGAGGSPVVAVRQELPAGGAQVASLTGLDGGPISELQIGRSGTGDGLVAFREGEPGAYEIVADWVTAPPQEFAVTGPKHWVKPGRARLNWAAAESAVGGVTYSVLLDGRAVESGLRKRQFSFPPGQLGTGVLRAQVLATDSLGQQALSETVKLQVDGEPPSVRVGLRGARVVVRLRDAGSGLRGKASRVSFGDGSSAHGGSALRHRYAAPGTYRVRVRAADVAGNHVQRSFEVRVR